MPRRLRDVPVCKTVGRAKNARRDFPKRFAIEGDDEKHRAHDKTPDVYRQHHGSQSEHN